MHEMQPVMKVLMSNCQLWRKVFIYFVLRHTSFQPVVTRHYSLTIAARATRHALLRCLLIGSAQSRNIHVTSMTLSASWHTSPKRLSPVLGSESCDKLLAELYEWKWKLDLSQSHLSRFVQIAKSINDTLIQT
jgi:hypothetical protein